MELIWHGHSCFRLRGKELTILTDPFDLSRRAATGQLQADVVTISHDESNHNAVAVVEGTPRVLTGRASTRPAARRSPAWPPRAPRARTAVCRATPPT